MIATGFVFISREDEVVFQLIRTKKQFSETLYVLSMANSHYCSHFI